MQWEKLKQLAKRNGIIRWSRTGVIEKLQYKHKMILAWGAVTPMHKISFKIGANYDCIEIDPKSSISIGEMISYRGSLPWKTINLSAMEMERNIQDIENRAKRRVEAKMIHRILNS